MTMTKEAVKQEVIDLLLAIQKVEYGVGVAKLKKTLSDTLVKTLDDNISFVPSDLRGCDIGPDGEKILGDALIGLLEWALSYERDNLK